MPQTLAESIVQQERIRDSLQQELETELAERRAAQLVGKGVKTTYSANGRSVDWNSYLKTMLDAIKAATKEIEELKVQNDPYEYVTEAW